MRRLSLRDDTSVCFSPRHGVLYSLNYIEHNDLCCLRRGLWTSSLQVRTSTAPASCTHNQTFQPTKKDAFCSRSHASHVIRVDSMCEEVVWRPNEPNGSWPACGTIWGHVQALIKSYATDQRNYHGLPGIKDGCVLSGGIGSPKDDGSRA